jgi:hypothetical protein
MSLKTLEQYIAQYGEISGTKRFLGIQKSIKTKEEKYAKQPFARLSKEWYIWRYGQEIGLSKFNSFASKSTQSLENFIKRYGIEKGQTEYLSCIAKKNTVALVREQKGDAAVNEWYSKVSISNKGKIRSRESKERSSLGQKKLNLISKKDRFINKYGEKEGIVKYLEHKKKVYAGPNRATKPVLNIISILEKRLPKEAFDDLYFGARDRNEYWLRDRDTNKLFFYDIVDPKAQLIIEYDGAFWHPRDDNLDLNKKVGAEIHPITKIPLRKMMFDDFYKKAVADENNFYLFLIHENDSLNRQEMQIDWFCSRALNYNRTVEEL